MTILVALHECETVSMGTYQVRLILVLAFGTFCIGFFGSCSGVKFDEKPIAACNGSSLACSQAVENGQRVNSYNYMYQVPYPKADILFVVDNSKSMALEQQKLAGAFSNFASVLNGLDWQAVITTTDMTTTGMGGKLVDINTSAGPVKILNAQIPNYENAFSTAISGQGENGSNDERGILSALRVIENGEQTGFLRTKSHLAVVVLSDEDERSTYGVQGFQLTSEEEPRGYVNRVNEILANAAHSFYSIIIRPGDTACFDDQKKYPQTLQGYYGVKYFETQALIAKEIYGKTLNALTSPEVGNICGSSYSILMEQIAGKIKERTEDITLPCDPIPDPSKLNDPNQGRVTLVPNLAYSLEGRRLIITPTPSPGQSIQFVFKCHAS